MESMDKLLKELKGMDKEQLTRVLETAGEKLSDKQQKKIKTLMRDKAQLSTFKEKLKDSDVNDLVKNLQSKEQLSKFLSDPAVKDKISKLLD